MKQILALVLMSLAPLAAFAQQQVSIDLDTRCSQQLVSYADWPKDQSSNFLLDITSPPGRLYYFGAQHSADPAHSQFAEIEKAWNVVKPTIAFYEGPNRPITAIREETIKQVGESGFVRFLATRDRIPFVSLEPSPHEEATYILKKYSPEQVMLFYVLREAARLRDRRKLSEEELKKAVAQLLAQASKMKGFEAVMPNIDALDTAYRKYWSDPAQWWQAPAQWFDPGRSTAETGGRFTNEINRMSSEYRDLHMFRHLAKAVLEGNRVFAVVGRNHVPMQERALRCALEYAVGQTTGGQAKSTAEDEEGIRKVLSDFVEAWNKHDAKAFSMVFAEDADFTNVRGTSTHGRAEVEKFHAPLFATRFKDTKQKIAKSRIRFIKPDVAAVDAWWEMTGAKGAEGQDIPLRRGLLSFVITKQSDKWLITVMHNMDLPASQQ